LRQSDFVRIITDQPQVTRLEPLTEDIKRILREFEFTPVTPNYLPVEHRGFDEVTGCDSCFILFCRGGMSMSLEPFMDLVDSEGRRVGHDILPSERHLYDSPDYIWLSDTLFFDVNKVDRGEMRCIIHSVRFDADYIPDSVEARICFPCTSSVDYLLDLFEEDREKASVLLLGVRGLEPE